MVNLPGIMRVLLLSTALLSTCAPAYAGPYAPLVERSTPYKGERGLVGEICWSENGAVWCRLDPGVENLPAPPVEPTPPDRS